MERTRRKGRKFIRAGIVWLHCGDRPYLGYSSRGRLRFAPYAVQRMIVTWWNRLMVCRRYGHDPCELDCCGSDNGATVECIHCGARVPPETRES